MPKDDRKLLPILRAELAFLERGGYRKARSTQWRSPLLLQDSPMCLNFDRTKAPRPCHECVMTSLVPPDCREERFPCQHIPLNGTGFTIDTFYRLGTFEDAESAVRAWLVKNIHEFETETESEYRSKI